MKGMNGLCGLGLGLVLTSCAREFLSDQQGAGILAGMRRASTRTAEPWLDGTMPTATPWIVGPPFETTMPTAKSDPRKASFRGNDAYCV